MFKNSDDGSGDGNYYDFDGNDVAVATLESYPVIGFLCFYISTCQLLLGMVLFTSSFREKYNFDEFRLIQIMTKTTIKKTQIR